RQRESMPALRPLTRMAAASSFRFRASARFGFGNPPWTQIDVMPPAASKTTRQIRFIASCKPSCQYLDRTHTAKTLAGWGGLPPNWNTGARMNSAPSTASFSVPDANTAEIPDGLGNTDERSSSTVPLAGTSTMLRPVGGRGLHTFESSAAATPTEDGL